MSPPISLDLISSCRLCLSQEGLLPLFPDTESQEDIFISMPKRIMTCVAIEVSQEDNFPKNICEVCKKSIDDWEKFKEQCDRVNSTLHQIVDSQTTAEYVEIFSKEDNEEGDIQSDRGAPSPPSMKNTSAVEKRRELDINLDIQLENILFSDKLEGEPMFEKCLEAVTPRAELSKNSTSGECSKEESPSVICSPKRPKRIVQSKRFDDFVVGGKVPKNKAQESIPKNKVRKSLPKIVKRIKPLDPDWSESEEWENSRSKYSEESKLLEELEENEECSKNKVRNNFWRSKCRPKNLENVEVSGECSKNKVPKMSHWRSKSRPNHLKDVVARGKCSTNEISKECKRSQSVSSQSLEEVVREECSENEAPKIRQLRSKSRPNHLENVVASGECSTNEISKECKRSQSVSSQHLEKVVNEKCSKTKVTKINHWRSKSRSNHLENVVASGECSKNEVSKVHFKQSVLSKRMEGVVIGEECPNNDVSMVQCDQNECSKPNLHSKPSDEGNPNICNDKENRFKCSIDGCEKKFDSFIKVLNHDRADHADLPFDAFCGICSENFISQDRLTSHKYYYHGRKKFTCELCGAKLNTERGLQHHRTYHKSTNNGRYKCERCGDRFVSIPFLLAHIRMHTGEYGFKCELCKMKFRTPFKAIMHRKFHLKTDLRRLKKPKLSQFWPLKADVLLHKKKVCNERPNCSIQSKPSNNCNQKSFQFMCGVGGCEKTFDSFLKVLFHDHAHHGNLPFDVFCRICSKGFISQDRLTVHKQYNHGRKRFTCELCRAKFTTERGLLQHKAWHRSTGKFMCALCGKEFDSIPYLLSHTKVHDREDRFKCDLCRMKFSTAFEVSLHRISHFNKNLKTKKKRKLSYNRPTKTDVISHDQNRINVCNERPTSSMELKPLEDVQESEEFSENEVDNACFQCSVVSEPNVRAKQSVEENPSNFNQKENKYICSVDGCEKTFDSFINVLNHDRVDHAHLPLDVVCSVCSKTFISQDRLAVHKNDFHCKETFSCDLCNVKCRNVMELRRHKKGHTDRFKCERCGETFENNLKLLKHIRMHIKQPFKREKTLKTAKSQRLHRSSQITDAIEVEEVDRVENVVIDHNNKTTEVVNAIEIKEEDRVENEVIDHNNKSTEVVNAIEVKEEDRAENEVIDHNNESTDVVNAIEIKEEDRVENEVIDHNNKTTEVVEPDRSTLNKAIEIEKVNKVAVIIGHSDRKTVKVVQNDHSIIIYNTKDKVVKCNTKCSH